MALWGHFRPRSERLTYRPASAFRGYGGSASRAPMPGSVFNWTTMLLLPVAPEEHHLLPPSKIRCRIFVRLAAVPNYLLQENQHCKQFPDGTCSSVEASTLDVNELRLKAKREVQEITS